jgi:hypothetical protein
VHIQPRTMREHHIHDTPPVVEGLAGYPDQTTLQCVLSSQSGGGHTPWCLQVSGSNGSSGSQPQRLDDLVTSPVGGILPPVVDADEPSTIFIHLGARARAW